MRDFEAHRAARAPGLVVAALLAVACLVAAVEAPAQVTDNRHSVAVIIGNKAYGAPLPDVDYAHNDAEAIRRFAVDILGYREGNVIDLRDATLAQLVAVFGDDRTASGKLSHWVRPGLSNVLVFYSGHGVPGLADRRGYLLPVDGDPNLAEINGYPLDRLLDNLARLDARSVTVLLDTCFSGNSQGGPLLRSASISITPKPGATSPAPELVVLTAARNDQLASWDAVSEHGLFTEFLLWALYGEADRGAYGDGDGSITAAEVMRYLDEEMSYEARRQYGREQNANLQGDPARVLVRYGAKGPPERPVVTARGVPRRHGLAALSTPRPDLDAPATGASFRDQRRDGAPCPECPEMVVIPAGEFVMGSPESEKGRDDDEGPQHRVVIPEPFALGRFEVTFAQWDACVADGGCNDYSPDDRDWGRGDRPVARVSWHDARAYVEWLAARTGQPYRLPSEAEWEYAARAGTRSAFYFGPTITAEQANYNGNYVYDGGRRGIFRDQTVPVGRFPANDFGLHDMHGNVWEWVADCWHPDYVGAPADGRAWIGGDCPTRVLRGGSWDLNPSQLRAALRYSGLSADYRGGTYGLRVARDLP